MVSDPLKLIHIKGRRDPAMVAWLVRVSLSHSVYCAFSGNGGLIPAWGMFVYDTTAIIFLQYQFTHQEHLF